MTAANKAQLFISQFDSDLRVRELIASHIRIALDLHWEASSSSCAQSSSLKK